MKQRFCLDSGVFINTWRKNLPIDVFPSVWDHLDRLCQEQIVFAPDEVAKEVFKRDDEVAKWLKARKKIIVSPDNDIVHQTKEIMYHYPKLAAEGSGRSGADPWVISFAFLKRAVLVTEETESKNPEKPRIPNVCKDLEIECTDTIGLLRATGFKL